MLNVDSRARAVPAKFNPADQRRRAMLAKLHVAKKQLALAEDDYRQILLDETGQRSAADCDAAALEKVLKRLEAIGFKPLPKKGAASAAQHPMAKKARALWISLYHLGAVRNSSEQALEAFAKRQLGCERLVWAKQSDAFRLIEALKAMAVKAGWEQTDAKGNNLSSRDLAQGLCFIIADRLAQRDEAIRSWSLNQIALRLCGIELGKGGPTSIEDYHRLAAALGEKLRAAGGEA